MLNNCPCCSEPLLRHARHGGVYWFCSHCWQEMPDLPEALVVRRQYQSSLQGLMRAMSGVT